MKKRPAPTHLSRTRFGDIVCEYLLPERTTRRVLILATGMPGYPGGSGNAVRALAARGYAVFVPRYRGSWESGGKFLARSPHEDMLEVISGIQKAFTDAWSREKVRIAKPEFYLIGASFGGPAAILASRDRRVKKAVALAPVVDWRAQEGSREPVEQLARFLKAGFGEAYRGDANAWKKLASGKFYSAVREENSIDGTKLLIIHAKDDDVVPFAPAKAFAHDVGARFEGLSRGGHFGVSSALKPHLWRRIEPFLKSR